ncbi:hypothetical protein EI94DRAFT_1702585 [Lactarius quietus]|nr:hypothetical protein EI94DRAFT_1702585 [Lactarius quietus]
MTILEQVHSLFLNGSAVQGQLGQPRQPTDILCDSAAAGLRKKRRWRERGKASLADTLRRSKRVKIPSEHLSPRKAEKTRVNDWQRGGVSWRRLVPRLTGLGDQEPTACQVERGEVFAAAGRRIARSGTRAEDWDYHGACHAKPIMLIITIKLLAIRLELSYVRNANQGALGT